MTVIQPRRGTASQWATANPVLAVGEVGYETDTKRSKRGDGATAWNALGYSGGGTPKAARSAIGVTAAVESFAELLSNSIVNDLAVGAIVKVRDAATYQVVSSGAALESVAAHVVTSLSSGGSYSTFPRATGSGYHVITNGGTKLRSITPYACPTHFGAAGNGSTDDTAAVQMAALYAADCGEFRPKAGTYLISSPITYFGRVKHVGSKFVQFYVANNANIDAAFVPYTWNSTSQADMQSKQLEKFRPEFHDLEIDCNGENNGAHYGIILTSTEAKVIGNWIWDAIDYAVMLTPFNKNGDTVPDGYNFLQNWICRNRLYHSGKGGIRCLDTSLSQCTDGWAIENSITDGSEYGIYIEGGAGWKVQNNQISSTRHGIGITKPNDCVASGNIINGFGEQVALTPVGDRYGIYFGGLTSSVAKAAIANNTIHGYAQATVRDDASTVYTGISFQASNASSKTSHIAVVGNALTFSGFSGTSTKIKAIRQRTNGSNNDITGIITGNSAVSDEGASGVVSTFIELHTLSRVRVGVNTNSGQRVEGRSKQATSSATPSINTDECDRFYITALAADITSMSTNLTGTPTDGQRLQVWFTGTASRAITWGSSFTGNLLARTVGTNTHVQELVYSSALGKWVGTYADHSILQAPGTGSPEGAVTAPVGSLFTRSDGGIGSTLYVKESGSGNTGWTPRTTTNPPTDFNDLLGWTMDPAVAATSQLLTAATVYFCRIPLRAPTTVTNVVLRLATAGATLTHSYAALFKSDGTMLRQSADQSADWAGSAGNRTVPLSSPVTVTPVSANDFVWAAFYVGTAGTAPTFTRGTNSAQVNMGVSSSRLRFGTIALADTDTLVNVTPSSMTAALNAFVVGIS